MPQIGVLFDIDDLDSGLYGYKAYQIFFAAVDTRQLSECSLSDGDINATLRGQVNQYCIAIETSYESTIAKVRNAISRSNAKGLLPLESRFMGDASVQNEPLVLAGRIDYNGELVGCNTSWVYEAWKESLAKHQNVNTKHDPPQENIQKNTNDHPENKIAPQNVQSHSSSVIWQVGDVIENRWEINSVLKGGLGIVYIGYDREFRESFAAKTFQDDVFALNKQVADRFVDESKAWIALDFHPNVATAKHLENIGGKPFLFLEYISGGDLSNWIDTPRLTEDLPQVLRFAIHLCDGMTHALSKGISVHRDIKPQNCLISEDGILKLTDFGLAKIFDNNTLAQGNGHTQTEGGKYQRWFDRLFKKREYLSATSQLPHEQEREHYSTQTGRGIGTFTHMAPEQFDDAKHVDVKADIYSFGVTLYQMLTGKLPFEGNTWEACEYHHKNSRPPKLTLITPVPQSLISHLDAIIQTCLAKDPAKRFKDFEDVRQPLAKVYKALTGEVVSIPAAGVALDAGRWNDKGLCLLRLGKVDEGLVCLNHALDLDSRHIAAWNNKGLALIELGKLDDALHCFEKAIEIFSHYADAWNNKGGALAKLNRPKEALSCFEKAIEINPKYATAWTNKGIMFIQLNQLKDALGCFTLAIKYNPHYAPAWYLKGLLIAQAGYVGCTKEALFHFEQAKQLGYQLAAHIIEKMQQE